MTSNNQMLNEQEIISNVLGGNLHAFKLLVTQHERLVFAMVKRVVGNEQDAEDICQEVFIKVYSHLSQFKFESKLSTWIARIAYLTALNHSRKVSGKTTLTEDIAKFESEDRITENPEHILAKKNVSEYIQHQINKLPLPYRTVLTLYHLNELSYREIEEITGMPEGTIKSYLYRARKLLKDRLKHHYK
jgi:RNA polymerase sigma-70 factor (ECF subfamily)